MRIGDPIFSIWLIPAEALMVQWISEERFRRLSTIISKSKYGLEPVKMRARFMTKPVSIAVES